MIFFYLFGSLRFFLFASVALSTYYYFRSVSLDIHILLFFFFFGFL